MTLIQVYKILKNLKLKETGVDLGGRELCRININFINFMKC